MVNIPTTSVIVPTKGCIYLTYLLRALNKQTVKPSEVVLVFTKCDQKEIEKLCENNDLNFTLIEQREGYFTHALNLGKKKASGDILIFTDDDAIPPAKWIERYVKLHEVYKDIAGISSRDIYVDLEKNRLEKTLDDMLLPKLYRLFVRSWLEPPHNLIPKKYRLGVYLTKDFKVAHGYGIPNKICYSLMFRGVNMSVKSMYANDKWFPEHPMLKTALGNEQYFGLQLLLDGFDTIYTPYNPVLHIKRDSLSRSKHNTELMNVEIQIMKKLFIKLCDAVGSV